MSYFNNIFICAYRGYKKTEKSRNPRFTSCVLISICLNSILFMTLMLFLRLLKLPNSSISFLGDYPFLAIGFAVLEMIILFQYYTEEKIVILNAIFVQKRTIERRIWGFVAILTLLLPTLIGALELNK